MENYLVLAPAPTEEDCVCVGEEDGYPRKAGHSVASTTYRK
jgi:hypothetical protein